MRKHHVNDRRLTPVEELPLAKSSDELRGVLWERVEQHLRPDKPELPEAAERAVAGLKREPKPILKPVARKKRRPTSASAGA